MVEELDIVNAVLQHGNAVHAHAEGEAADLVRIVAIGFNEAEDIRINHAAAEELDPSAGFAEPAILGRAEFASAATFEAGNLHVRARFSEGKEAGIETRLHAGAEEFFHGVVERALEVAKSDVGVHSETFHLVEDGRV